MARILWLDDMPWQVQDGVDGLRRDGHTVDTSTSEAQVALRLESGQLADILIQDLERSEVLTGWLFYEQVLRPMYPQLPVVICSLDAVNEFHRHQADDFNLRIIDKTDRLSSEISLVVRQALSAQVAALAPLQSPPQIVAVDFSRVNAALMRHLADRPADLHNVHWATFERLVERLLIELGYEVEHTPLSKDGGVDLWALHRSDLGDTLYAIDTKKYSPSRLVGPEPVRAIYGVADLAGASVGLIVTTSHFGPAARKLAEQYRYRVALKDFDGLINWIRIVSGKFAAQLCMEPTRS